MIREVQSFPLRWWDDRSVPPSTDYRDFNWHFRFSLGHDILRHKGLTEDGNPGLFSTSFHEGHQFDGRLVSLSAWWQHNVYVQYTLQQRHTPLCSCRQVGRGAKGGWVLAFVCVCVCVCVCVTRSVLLPLLLFHTIEQSVTPVCKPNLVVGCNNIFNMYCKGEEIVLVCYFTFKSMLMQRMTRPNDVMTPFL